MFSKKIKLLTILSIALLGLVTLANAEQVQTVDNHTLLAPFAYQPITKEDIASGKITFHIINLTGEDS